MTPAYITICLLNFAIVAWVLIKVLRDTPFPPKNDDDDGGLPTDFKFPIFDLPSGSGLDDLLVDRPPKEFSDSPHRTVPQKIKS